MKRKYYPGNVLKYEEQLTYQEWLLCKLLLSLQIVWATYNSSPLHLNIRLSLWVYYLARENQVIVKKRKSAALMILLLRIFGQRFLFFLKDFNRYYELNPENKKNGKNIIHRNMFSVVLSIYTRIPETVLFDKDDGYSVTLICRDKPKGM